MVSEVYFLGAENKGVIALPSIKDLKGKWKKIPDERYKDLIAMEEQFFHFAEFIVSKMIVRGRNERLKITHPEQGLYRAPKAMDGISSSIDGDSDYRGCTQESCRG